MGELRVMEHIDTTTVINEMSGSRTYSSKKREQKSTNPFSLLGNYFSKAATTPTGRIGSKNTQQQSRGSHNLAYDNLSSKDRSIEWVIEDQYGSYAIVDTKTCIPDYFRLTKSFEEFKPVNPPSGQSSDAVRTVGFKTIEQVLEVGQKLLVFGEVANVEIDDNGLKVVDIRAPRSHGFFDIRTARVTPYIVSTMDEEEMIQKVETNGRSQFLGASLFGIAGFIFFLQGTGLIRSRRY